MRDQWNMKTIAVSIVRWADYGSTRFEVFADQLA
jgi:hypothetical protein